MKVTKDCHGEVGLWDKMRRLLQSHFTDSDAELVLGEFKEVGGCFQKKNLDKKICMTAFIICWQFV